VNPPKFYKNFILHISISVNLRKIIFFTNLTKQTIRRRKFKIQRLTYILFESKASLLLQLGKKEFEN